MTLTQLFTNIANAIRAKTGSSSTIIASNFPTEITNIELGYEKSEGENLNLKNSANAQLAKLNISGNSVQDGTPTPSNQVPINSAGDAKNLYFLPEEGSSNGINYTKNDDGTINLVGTATANVSFPIFKNITQAHIENGATYTFSSNQALPSGVEFRAEAFNNTSWLRHLIGSVLNSSHQVLTGTANLANATRIRHFIYIASGTTVNLTNLGIQFEKGSVKTSFTPEGKGSINEVISNKNLLPNNIESGTINGITVIKDVDGGYIFNGTAERGTYFYMFDNKIIKIPAGTYKQSVHKSGNVNGNSYFEMIDINGNTVSGGALNMYNTESKTITLTQDVWIKNARIYFGNGRILNNFKIYPMLEAGNVITDYVEHQEQNISIPCQQPMRSIGNVRDGFVKIDGVWYEKHNIGQVVLNGSENWEVYSGASNIFFSNISSLPLPKNANLNVFCNYYTSTLSTNSVVTFVSETTGLNYAIGTHVTAPIVRIKDIRYTTPSELSSWLSTHNTEVIYQLAEPNYIECTQEQIQALESIIRAYTYEPITNINSTDEVSPYLDLVYYKKI